MPNKIDLSCMRRAVDEARKCQPEDDRVHPFVAAVFARNDRLIDAAYRGETQAGDHAEYILLEHKVPNETAAGATVYTTLEPCTARKHPKVSCVERLIARKVKRVVIGMLDPNQTIAGKGILRLREANVQVDLFPSKLMRVLEDLNRSFIASHRTPGDLMLPAWIGYKPLDAFVPQDARQVVLIGQNLSSRFGLDKQAQRSFAGELRSVLERGTEVLLVVMTPSALKAIHLEAAEDLGQFTLPALRILVQELGQLSRLVQVVFHPAATLSLIAVDKSFAYITPKFQITAQISERLSFKLEPRLFDSTSLERMLYEARKKCNGAMLLPLQDSIAELRSQLDSCNLPAVAEPNDGTDINLEHILTSRLYQLHFNPTAGRSKKIAFFPGGVIKAGRNRNENSWRLDGSRLEILAVNGSVYSRFNYNSERDRFEHTNDSDTPSIRDQIIVPQSITH